MGGLTHTPLVEYHLRMELNTTAQIREAILALPRAEWDALAQESGVPRSTVEKIAYGVTVNPGFDKMAGLVLAMKKRSVSSPSAPASQEAA